MTISYFGYGSLVNAATVPADAVLIPGKLQGWRREWRVCGVWETGQGRCALSVRQDLETEIRGVMTHEPATRMDALETRESRYFKVDGIAQDFRCDADGKPGPEGLFLFQATPENRNWGSDRCPILQSYLDCVLAGFFQLWGEEGIDHFIETTDGWHVPVLNDRSSPLYPRAVQLEEGLRVLIDAKLAPLSLSYTG